MTLVLETIVIPIYLLVFSVPVQIFSSTDMYSTTLALSDFEVPEILVKENELIDDLWEKEELLKNKSEEIQEWLKKCNKAQVILGMCPANVLYENVKKELAEHNKLLGKQLTQMKSEIDKEYSNLVALGIENETQIFRELYVAKRRLEGFESSKELKGSIESKVLAFGENFKIFFKYGSIENYVKASNIIAGKDSLYFDLEKLHVKIKQTSESYQEELKSMELEFEININRMKIMNEKVKDEDLSVVEYGTYKIKPSAGIVPSNSLDIYVNFINSNRNVIEKAAKNGEKGYLKNSLEFYQKSNQILEENILFYESKTKKLTEELERLENEYDMLDEKYKRKMINPDKAKTKSEKIKILLHNLELYEMLKKNYSELNEAKDETMKEIITLEDHISLSFEKTQLEKAETIDDITLVKNLIFAKNEKYSKDLQKAKRICLEKSYILSSVGYILDCEYELTKDVEEKTRDADKIIESNKEKFLVVSANKMLSSKPYCSSEITYQKIFTIINRFNVNVENFAVENEFVSLLPYETKTISKEEKIVINCEIKKEIVKADNYWKYIYMTVKTNNIFNETLLRMPEYSFVSGNVEPFSDVILMKYGENEVMYKEKTKLDVKKLEYQVENTTVLEVLVTNIDENFENLYYEIYKTGNVACENCITTSESAIFELKNFKIGETRSIRLTIYGEVAEKTEKAETLPDFEKKYENFTSVAEEKTEINLCWLTNSTENCENEILSEISEKIKLKKLREKITKAKNMEINTSEAENEVVKLEKLSINLENPGNIIEYYTSSQKLDETLDSQINEVKIKAQEKLILAKQKFDVSEEKNVLYDYLEAAVGDFQNEKFMSSIENSEKIINYQSPKQDFTLYYIIISLVIIGIGILFFQNKKKPEIPLKKKILKLFEDEF